MEEEEEEEEDQSGKMELEERGVDSRPKLDLRISPGLDLPCVMRVHPIAMDEVLRLIIFGMPVTCIDGREFCVIVLSGPGAAQPSVQQCICVRCVGCLCSSVILWIHGAAFRDMVPGGARAVLAAAA
ncbi:hypothetical protein KOW79_007207 [Hemibagrus wyckioides]|uniref:Uncharacterized protein n=1 Tax=Hemibagrus wyckioides TaxID=337641 RepID=A0A9D3NU28_9TELE|nr:hypothetical protein KOW79_007207 [Hemibagrus wyckioides]